MLNKRNLVLSLLGAGVLVTSPVGASAEKILKNGAFTGKSPDSEETELTLSPVKRRRGSKLKDSAPSASMTLTVDES